MELSIMEITIAVAGSFLCGIILGNMISEYFHEIRRTNEMAEQQVYIRDLEREIDLIKSNGR